MAIQNTVEPEAVVMALEEERMLSAPSSLSSEDDEELARGVAARPYTIGFFGYAYYQRHADELRVLTVDGVVPTADTVDSGDYGLARPLVIYTTAEIIREKPQVSSFVHYYLTHVNEEIGDIGYFPASRRVLKEGGRRGRRRRGVAVMTGERQPGTSSPPAVRLSTPCQRAWRPVSRASDTA
jgi:phosphate transport system substrate-binding protein